MKLPITAHTAQPWRIHAFVQDFKLLDVWALPTPGGPDDFPLLVELMTALDPTRTSSRTVRLLFEARRRLGGLAGWDAPQTGVGGRVGSLRERLPRDLQGSIPASAFDALPATPLYATADEFVAEVANQTVHGLLHLGWVQEGDSYRGQLAILVKPNGALGRAYLAAISPFRHLIVYPALMRAIGSEWERLRARG